MIAADIISLLTEQMNVFDFGSFLTGFSNTPGMEKASLSLQIASGVLGVLTSDVSVEDVRYIVTGSYYAGHFIYTPEGEFICMYIYDIR